MHAPDYRQERLSRLRALASRLVDGPMRTAIEDCLDATVEVLDTRLAVIVRRGQWLMERGPRRQLDADAREALDSVAHVARAARASYRIENLDHAPGNGEALRAAGFGAAVAIPLRHQRLENGVLVLLFGEAAFLDDELMEFALTVADFISVTLEPECRSTAPASPIEPDAPPSTAPPAPSLTPLDDFARGLIAPTAALQLQIEELYRVRNQLELFGDQSDAPFRESMSELTAVLDDAAIAASTIRLELRRMTSWSEDEVETNVELSEVVREALTIARAELERRGLQIHESLGASNSVQGHRRDVLHLVLEMVFAVARAGERVPQSLHVGLETSAEQPQIFVTIGGSPTRPIAPPRSCQELAERHGATVGELPNGLHATFPPAIVERCESHRPRVKQVLLVDDDPLFCRAVRRALKPHDVRICATVADGVIALLDDDFDPDIVICDLWLPGADGTSLHQRMAMERPEVAPRFVFVSGAPRTTGTLSYPQASGCPLLQKPVALRDLLALVESDSEPPPPSRTTRSTGPGPMRPPDDTDPPEHA